MISYIICAFNEEDNLKDTINSIYDAQKKIKFEYEYEIIIVDDGSNDETFKIATDLKNKDKNIYLIKNTKNIGYGESLKKGLIEVNYEKFIVIPGDNDLTSDTIASGLSKINNADLIMIFPVNIENRSKVRNLISIVFKMIYLAIFNCYVNYINSPAIYPTRFVKKFNLKSSKFSIIAEITTKILHQEITYIEVPTIFKTSLRRRKTVTFSNLIEVITSFINLYLEIKFLNKKHFLYKAKRINEI